ncbi:Snake venom metalloprotease inhibitor 02A10 [Amphibalanus amphitrite]|uniref:Snake venom metalloprotease inhibitor 02A10 n=1 Tax=Amphibalanus amphitrite TaxID=1232801 RepID=A0A6A4V8H5_AMPAM|nr:Snake venom metalloprotease inhibitor 02A10 [Amphibalanus amphitrite]
MRSFHLRSMQPKAVQLAMLRSCLSDDTVHIVENMGLSRSDGENVSKIIENLERHAIGQHRSAPTVAVDVFGTRRGKLRALPDTGADISLAGPEFAETFGRGRMTPSTVRPMVVDGRSCDSIGKVEVTIRMGDIEVNEQVHIIPGVKRLILSWKTTQRLGIIPEDYPEQKWNIPQDITAAVSARRTITRPAERQTAALGPPVERQTAALGPLSERQTAAFGPPVERQTAALGPPVERQTAALGPPVERQTAALGAPAEQRAARTGAPGPAEQRAAPASAPTEHQVMVQNHVNKRWDRSGVITEVDGRRRRYFIRLPSGRVLTRNRRFLRQRYAYSEPHAVSSPAVEEEQTRLKPAQAAQQLRRQQQQQQQQTSLKPAQTERRQQQQQQPLRRSTRIKKQTRRLIEEM